MATLVKHLEEPYRYPINYSDYSPLLAFMRRVVHLLAAGFAPPDTIVSRQEQPETGRNVGRMALRLGDHERGWEIEHVSVTHPHWGFLAAESTAITAYGLSGNDALSIAAKMTFDGHARSAFLELRADGSDEAVAAVTEAFEAEFGSPG
jgi:hypothetical protein